MEKLKMHTPDLTEENFRKLAALFPNAVTETANENDEIVRAIDADVLRQEISAEVVEGRKERYQFTWPDKKKSVVLANAPIAKTLRLEREKSVGRDGTEGSIDTENIYIEGDNLDALKLLRETYLGQVKMIYIDPPYNTKKDSFIYDDDFTMPGTAFAENSGAVDENGNQMFDLRVNNESNGRFHTDWLNMIYPRLRLARDLLADDGVIFISIDDHEQENLKKICDEIFGHRNRIACLIWQKKTSPDARMDISTAHDYILIYAKNKPQQGFLLNAIAYDESRRSNYKNPDNDPRGEWASGDITGQTGRAPKSQFYEITTPSGRKYFPPEGRCWAMSKSTFDMLYEDNRLWFGKGGNNRPRLKKFLKESAGQRPWTWWDNKFASYNQASNKELMKLFDGKLVFDNPKPIQLLSRIIELSTESHNHDIILDFFSGSATTAHAVMEMNSKTEGNRRFICIQVQDKIKDTGNDFKANNTALELGYHTICDIGEERIRRAGKKIKEETGADIDYGFRVLRVDSSNMRDVYYRTQDLKQTEIELLADNIKEDRTPEDLLFQVMLDLGILLSSKIEEKNIAGKKVFMVDGVYLIACFDADVTEEVVTAIAQENPIYAVFRDSSIASDAVMTNFEQIFKTHSPRTEWKVL